MKTDIRKNIALLAGSTLLSLLIAELTARFVFRDITTTFDNRSYFAMKWNRDHVRLNSLGFREREFDPSRKGGEYRIALIGDSFGFGHGIDTRDRMSSVLEAELEKRGRPAEVLFFGDVGINTADELAVLRKILPIARPDFVLLQWFINDGEIPAGDEGTDGRSRSAWASLKRQARHSIALYFLAATAWHQATEDRGGAYVEEIARKFGDPASPDSRRADEALRAFFLTCRENQVPCGVVLVPFIGYLGNRYPFGYLHDRVLASCTTEQVTCVDLRATFELYGRQNDYRSLWVNRFDSHMSPLANRLAAGAVLGTFEQEWMRPTH